MARKLRIAASVFFAVATVALAVLWVRSYSCCDQVEMQLPGSVGLSTESVRGLLSFWIWDHDSGTPFRIWSTPIRDWLGQPVENVSFWYPMNRGMGFDAGLLWMPHGILALILASLAALPWRFSLRTLLIATTLVAVLLGLATWLAS